MFQQKKYLLRLFSCVVFLIATQSSFAQWQWARGAQAGANGGFDEGWSVATDANHNAFACGNLASSSLTFGSTVLTNTNYGCTDLLLAKYDPNGNVLWAKSAGGMDFDVASGVATDPAGNVYVTGYFRSDTIVFGNDTLFNSGPGDYDIFLAKYSPSGNELWARSAIGTSSLDMSYTIASDTLGNVYISGYFGSSSITFGSFTLTNSGSTDIFIAKYNSAGTVLWAKKAGGTGDDESMAVSSDGAGNVSITGYFHSSTMQFGSYTLNNPSGWQNIFVARYDPSGNVLWAESFAGGTDDDYAEGITTDNSSNIYITGAFQSAGINFGATFLGNSSTSGTGDVFLVKLDASGNVVWAQRAGGSMGDDGHCIAADNLGQLYLTGGFNSFSITFGTSTLLQQPGSTDPMFLFKFDTSGTVLCASVLKSGGDDNAGIATNKDLDVAYICGDFQNVNPFVVGIDSLYSPNGGEAFFIAAYNCGETGIGEKQNEDPLSIFPDPSDGKFYLNTPDEFRNARLEIYNSAGEKIYSSTVCEKQNEIDLGEEARGIYFLEIFVNDKMYSRKIIIE